MTFNLTKNALFDVVRANFNEKSLFGDLIDRQKTIYA